MSLDGIVTRAVVYELNNNILGGKIEKVYQPENDEILINIRRKGENYKLLLSASSNNPRIYLTNYTKSNPVSPPMFCMLLRKHLHGSKIIDITQASMDRIIHIDVQGYDELGVLTTKTLTIEIMGRHSNIILSDKESGKIIDSVKRVTPDISSVRQVLPGMEYKLPPSQNKLNPLHVEEDSFLEKINSCNEGTPIFKFLYMCYLGISPLIAREICWLAKTDQDTKIGALSNEDKKVLFSAFNSFMNEIKQNNYNPTIVMDEKVNKIRSFSAVDINQYNDIKKMHYDSISEVLKEYFQTSDTIDRIKQKSANLKKVITTKLDRASNKLMKQNEELLAAEKREKYKIYGDLITANLYKIEKGQKEVEVQNFYSEAQENINIKLDVRLTPSKNAQKYYKRYNKLKNAYEFVSKEIVNTKKEIEYLEHVLVSIDNCFSVNELEEIREELYNEGYVKRISKNKRKKQTAASNPRHYISSDGYDIYVGKNNKQNDFLTLKLASKEDIWFHTKVIPGSHVILKTMGEEVPSQSIMEAALLAAYYSKGKMSSQVPVDYTERRNVRKPNGAKPGMVIYDNNNTIYVTPKAENIVKIKELEK